MARRSGRSLTFKDAVRILDDGSPFVRDLDQLIEHAFDAIPAGPLLGLPYFAFRRKLVEYGEKLVSGIRDRVDGVGRYDRTQRLNAAHTVIVMTAFADAVGELLDGADLRDAQGPGEAGDPGMHGNLILDFERVDLPDPGPRRVEWIESLYVLTDHLSHLITTWGLDPDTVHLDELPELARRRYEENYRRLAVQVPEFAVWAYLAEHEATRDGVAEGRDELRRVGDELRSRLDTLTTGLAAMPELLAEVSGKAAANRVRKDLARKYQAVLTHSVLGEAQTPKGIVLPTLERAYVNPAVRVAEIDSNCWPSEDHWWEDQPTCDNVQALIVGQLTAPDAVDRPLIILGQPGAGKSKLTQMLAARLVDRGFLPVRVELRNVRADASVQIQIEHAIYAATHRSIGWPEVADSARADGLLPLVILDGFDELLQATGVNRTDYLEQVARFQREEYELGRPMATIVTSRTVVADRARFPDGTTALRLEPFDEPRVATWLDVWNEANGTSLDAASMLRYGELAEQPLLLTLLALYDAETGELRAAGPELSRAELYDRLLTEFARREVKKPGTNMDEEQERRAVADELRNLELVALAMFNRHSKSVTAAQLDYDLAGVPLPVRDDTGMAKPLTAAQLMVGRFFFVHESSATRADEREHAYEFLHATLGEFLVARHVVEALRELARDREYFRSKGRSDGLDDGELWTALSFAAVTGSAASVEFVEALLLRLTDSERRDIRELAVELLEGAQFPNPRRSRVDYEPKRQPVFVRHAYYSANLTVLAILSTGDPLETPLAGMGVWFEALQGQESRGLLDTVRAIKEGADSVPKIVAEDGSDICPYESGLVDLLDETYAGLLSENGMFVGPSVQADSPFGRDIRRQAFMSGHEPYLAILLSCIEFLDDIGYVWANFDGVMVPLPRVIMELRLTPNPVHEADKRVELYECCFRQSLRGRRVFPEIALRQLREDVRELPARIVAGLLISAFDEGAAGVAFDAFCSVLRVLRDTDDQAFASVSDHVQGQMDEAGVPEADDLYERMRDYVTPNAIKIRGC